ncbi:DUF4197 domain-containing protein [Vreelandella aquamarina]|uniref:DUF4197 domain-containing protein n=1 Tax=Vreelandella aquamarina TaxID=77097 RepID=UPI00384E5FA7
MKKWLALAGVMVITSGCQNMDAMGPLMDAGSQMGAMSGESEASPLASGIKQALALSSERASDNLSMPGAFDIPLPGPGQQIADTLRQLGMGQYVDPVQNAMNRGAEQAVAEAAPVFKTAVQEMSVDDAMGIIRGGDTAATQYFRANTEDALRSRFAPIVQSNLEQTGFYDQYQSMLQVYDQLPMTNLPEMDLERHVVDNSMEALFSEIGAQESLIRQDPAGQGSALIGQAFGLLGNQSE